MPRRLPRLFVPALTLAIVLACTWAFSFSIRTALANGGDDDGRHHHQQGDQGGDGGDDNEHHGHTPVTLCHWVPAHSGSYVTITVDDDGSSGNANMQGHAGHANDIIPAGLNGCPHRTPEVEATQIVPTQTFAPSPSAVATRATHTVVTTRTAAASATAAPSGTVGAATFTPE